MLVLTSIQSLLEDANYDDPLDMKVFNQKKKNEKLYNKTAKQWTKKYASPAKSANHKFFETEFDEIVDKKRTKSKKRKRSTPQITSNEPDKLVFFYFFLVFS